MVWDEIVLLRLWNGLSYKEIAELTGKSEAASKMMFLRTVDHLKTELSPSALLLLQAMRCLAFMLLFGLRTRHSPAT